VVPWDKSSSSLAQVKYFTLPVREPTRQSIRVLLARVDIPAQLNGTRFSPALVATSNLRR